MFYPSNEARAKSWLAEAETCRQRGYHIMAATCERIAMSYLK